MDIRILVVEDSELTRHHSVANRVAVGTDCCIPTLLRFLCHKNFTRIVETCALTGRVLPAVYVSEESADAQV